MVYFPLNSWLLVSGSGACGPADTREGVCLLLGLYLACCLAGPASWPVVLGVRHRGQAVWGTLLDEGGQRG